MRGYFVNLISIIVTCMLLLLSVGSNAFGNRWYPTDRRCSGGFIRAGQSVQTGKSAGQYWAFNENSGSCEREQYGNSDTFSSKKECDQACLNIYHFS